MVKINFNELVPNTYNPRKLFRGATMEELRKSIKQVGLIEPLVVRKLNGKYEIVCGMRRYYALKDLKTKEVECDVKELNDEQAKLIALIENIQRENLNPMEEARAYALNLGIDYTDDAEISAFQDSRIEGIGKFGEEIGKDTGTIRGRLYLLTLPGKIQDAIEKKDINYTRAFEIARLRQIKKEDLRHRLMENVFDEYMERQDSMSLDKINQRINKVLEDHKEEEEKEEKEIEDQIDSLRNEIIETKEARNIILDKIRNTLTNSYKKLKNITVENIENIESIKIPEKDIEIIKGIKTIEDIKALDSLDFLDEYKAYLVLEFLSKAKEKYADNREYESIVSRINIIGNRISDALLLLERSKKENIIICPYCHARIDTEIIKRDIGNYREELEPLKEKRSNIAGMEREIITIEKDLIRFLKGIDSKDGFIEKFNKQIKDLEKDLEGK